MNNKILGKIPEWPNGADCKSAGVRLRWFESISSHSFLPVGVAISLVGCSDAVCFCGSSSVDRALAFQAKGREFEPRLPLKIVTREARVTCLYVKEEIEKKFLKT